MLAVLTIYIKKLGTSQTDSPKSQRDGRIFVKSFKLKKMQCDQFLKQAIKRARPEMHAVCYECEIIFGYIDILRRLLLPVFTNHKTLEIRIQVPDTDHSRHRRKAILGTTMQTVNIILPIK